MAESIIKVLKISALIFILVAVVVYVAAVADFVSTAQMKDGLIKTAEILMAITVAEVLVIVILGKKQ